MQFVFRYTMMIALIGIALSGNAQTDYFRTKKDLQKYRQYFWEHPCKPKGFINDQEKLYSIDEEHKLDSLVKNFKKCSGIEIALITVDTTCVSKNNFDELILRIANVWGVGQKGKNNGILIGISKGYHIMRIENGYGIEKLITDQETKQIIDTAFIPYFTNNRYYDGTVNGLITLMELLNTKLN